MNTIIIISALVLLMTFLEPVIWKDRTFNTMSLLGWASVLLMALTFSLI